MKILFIGGNGNISWWCVEEAIKRGYEVYELNRGMTRNTRRAVQHEVHEIIADIRDEAAVIRALGNETFDVICVLTRIRPGRRLGFSQGNAVNISLYHQRQYTGEKAGIFHFGKIRRNMARMWKIATSLERLMLRRPLGMHTGIMDFL